MITHVTLFGYDITLSIWAAPFTYRGWRCHKLADNRGWQAAKDWTILREHGGRADLRAAIDREEVQRTERTRRLSPYRSMR